MIYPWFLFHGPDHTSVLLLTVYRQGLKTAVPSLTVNIWRSGLMRQRKKQIEHGLTGATFAKSAIAHQKRHHLLHSLQDNQLVPQSKSDHVRRWHRSVTWQRIIRVEPPDISKSPPHTAAAEPSASQKTPPTLPVICHATHHEKLLPHSTMLCACSTSISSRQSDTPVWAVWPTPGTLYFCRLFSVAHDPAGTKLSTPFHSCQHPSLYLYTIYYTGFAHWV